jgi:hypothetical protein
MCNDAFEYHKEQQAIAGLCKPLWALHEGVDIKDLKKTKKNKDVVEPADTAGAA